MTKASTKERNTVDQLVRADFRLISQILCVSDPVIALEEYGIKHTDVMRLNQPYSAESIHEALYVVHRNNPSRKSIFSNPLLFEDFFEEFRSLFSRLENVLKVLSLKASSDLVILHEPTIANSIKTVTRLRHEYLEYFDVYYRKHCEKRIEKYPDYRERLTKRLDLNTAQRKAFKPSYAEILEIQQAYEGAVEKEIAGSGMLLHIAETALVDVNQIKFAVPEILSKQA